MKIVLFAFLVLSSNFSVFAYDETKASSSQSLVLMSITWLSSEMTVGNIGAHKEARQVMRDSQEYLVSGKVSVDLEKKINDKLLQDESLTNDEALEVVMDEAQVLLDSNR